MEPVSINALLFGALAFLIISVGTLLWAFSTMLPQVEKTIAAYVKLADTLDDELAPTISSIAQIMDLKAPWWWNDERFLKAVTAFLFMSGSFVFLSCFCAELPQLARWLLLPIYLIKSAALAREYFQSSSADQ